ncbi:hypothetical protein BJ875DRAFT_484556 [Amylocarpus encephaloides]|uniref:DUF7025 domain-containing protein n=1 Tax=Amylocarpus encephaloides TaxID=45428 RepID=A0A9P7YJ74_9HELO|nr:hypothetical protein BJ875DRAFT_484556 [Amylocarpus encephaloides]
METVCRITNYMRVSNKSFDGWDISYEYVEWNGQSCGYATSKAKISNFAGTIRVRHLTVYPLSFDDDALGIQTRLTARGRDFERLRGYHFLTYTGKKILLTKPEAKPVSSRVVIDAFAYYRSCNIVKPELKPLCEEVRGQEEKQKDEDREDSDSDDGSSDSSTAAGPALTTLVTNEPVARKEDLRSLTDEQCLLATPWLIGLDLKSKEWGQFLIEDLTEIPWTDTAFDNLVLPGGEKELAWSFLENKNLSNGGEWNDFIPEKGRGIIILMFGLPGWPKNPDLLYSISAGVLGTKPKEVEDALDHALELCRLWNAMLLLDEADIFLGARTNEGLARNELVSIFLTKLEYYQGILFLTTNRFSSIDYAFQSRIDLFLPYSDLTPPARKQVWENFITRMPDKFDIGEDGIRKLSEINLNGREIKNLIKSAQLLCFKSGDQVSAERLCILAENRVRALKLLKESDDYV